MPQTGMDHKMLVSPWIGIDYKILINSQIGIDYNFLSPPPILELFIKFVSPQIGINYKILFAPTKKKKKNEIEYKILVTL